MPAKGRWKVGRQGDLNPHQPMLRRPRTHRLSACISPSSCPQSTIGSHSVARSRSPALQAVPKVGPFQRGRSAPVRRPQRRRAWRLSQRHGRLGLAVAVLALGLTLVSEVLSSGRLQTALPGGWLSSVADLGEPVTYVRGGVRSTLPSAGGGLSADLGGFVTHVRDGDTIEVGGTPVRIANLDCAERNTVAGDRATRRMRELASGEQVTCTLEGRMSYDREVGTCKLAAIGQDLGRVLIGEGTCSRWQ